MVLYNVVNDVVVIEIIIVIFGVKVFIKVDLYVVDVVFVLKWLEYDV